MLKNLKLRTKLIAGFAIVAAIAAVIGVSGLLSIREVSRADQILVSERN